jgi:hypothetical protein
MAEADAETIAALGLGAGKCRVRTDDPAVLDFTHSSGAGEEPGARHLVLRSTQGAIRFPGSHALVAEGCARGTAAVDLAVTATGAFGFAVTLHVDGELRARGLGLADPDDEGALLVSWWTGTVEPYGIVKYSITDERTIAGYYISRMTPDRPGRDIATGDTTGGFPGSYTLMSEETSGRTWGPHHWELARRGDLIDLSWREHGRIFCRGLGIFDPQDPSSIIATYIPV